MKELLNEAHYWVFEWPNDCLREVGRCFSDWVFWHTSDVIKPDERNKQISGYCAGKHFQNFWITVNIGQVEMFYEYWGD